MIAFSELITKNMLPSGFNTEVIFNYLYTLIVALITNYMIYLPQHEAA